MENDQTETGLITYNPATDTFVCRWSDGVTDIEPNDDRFDGLHAGSDCWAIVGLFGYADIANIEHDGEYIHLAHSPQPDQPTK